MSDWSWLSQLCDPDRAPTRSVWTLTLNGEQWVAATNGRVLVATRGETGVVPDSAIAQRIPSLIADAQKGAAVSVKWAQVRAFVGAPAVFAPICPTCNNVGHLGECEECNGIGHTECECSCGDVHDKSCLECDGIGLERCPTCDLKQYPEIRKGWIGDSLFNLNLLAPVVFRLDADVVTMRHSPRPHGTESQVLFESPEWLMIVMPLRSTDAEKDTPRFDAVAA